MQMQLAHRAVSVWELHKDKEEVGKKRLFSYDSQPRTTYMCGRAADALGRQFW